MVEALIRSLYSPGRDKKGNINVHAANVKYNFPKSTQFEENICYVCGVTYTEEEWVGCDKCNRWFYYRCVGFNETPSSDTLFTVIDGKNM